LFLKSYLPIKDIVLFNIIGEKIYEQCGINKFEANIYLPPLSSGMYVLRIKYVDEKILNVKIFK